ncbi:MAG TPA: glutamate--tRNA ligase [Vicinamibacterales bacterium]|nr:glutamate--tRNA ligase [Vicinamibacterales bacterium]
MSVSPRVRFAPSPTGYLHIGGARTALFNWLFARRNGGVFVLRIEDTDVERSSEAMVDGILDGMRWLGLDWDEGPLVAGPHAPYFQSQRQAKYLAAAERLVAAGHAYYCYCTPEELKAKREGNPEYKYERTCLGLSRSEIDANEKAGKPRAVRFKVPAGTVRVDDLVKGAIDFDASLIEDFVILRSDGHAIYHLSVVADDVDMAITHVVRGDDHISNTPKQILLYQALGARLPKFAHVPLILGSDRKRLSKRHGATSVMEYASHGYTPEAMVNFLALLGWSPGAGNQEVFTKLELCDIFTLEGISGGNAVFNPEKLDWFNQQHLARLAPTELAARLKPSFEAAGLWSDDLLTTRHAWFFAVLELLVPRAKRLPDFVAQGAFFFRPDVEYDGAAVEKHLKGEGVAGHLKTLVDAWKALPEFDAVSTEAALRATAEARGVKAGTLIHAVRVAVTGTSVSPGIFEVVALVGRARVLERLVRYT